MALQWDITNVKNSREVCCLPLPPGPPQPDWVRTTQGEYLRLKPLTRALIQSTTQVGINKITPELVGEYLYRLNALFDADIFFWYMDGVEGPVPIRVGRHHLVAHIGLETNAPSIGNNAFDHYVRQLRIDREKSREFPSSIQSGPDVPGL